MQEQPQTIAPENTPGAASASVPQSAPQPEHDIFADSFTEADISAMFDADNGGNDDGGTPAPAEAPEGTQPPAQQEGESPQEQPAEQPAEQPKAEEQAQPDAYELPVFGKNVKLTGDQLIQAAEAGIQLMQHKPQVEKAMQLMQAVQTDPTLQAILQAYSKGQPLPAVTRGQQPMQGMPQPGSQEEALMAFQQQLMQHLLPQVVQAVEAKYKPFVDEVQTFAQQVKMEKAFAPYRSDPEYNAVNSLMTQNLQAKVNEGAISMQQAAEIDARLKADPELYGQWFGKFKAALKNAQKQAAAAPQPVQTVPHAPKLESSAAAAPTVAERARVGLAKALDGDPNGFNLLFDNQ
jgi:hypothetical protein